MGNVQPAQDLTVIKRHETIPVCFTTHGTPKWKVFFFFSFLLSIFRYSLSVDSWTFSITLSSIGSLSYVGRYLRAVHSTTVSCSDKLPEPSQ